MGSRKARRGKGTDVHRLWDLPPTEQTRAPNDNKSTGPLVSAEEVAKLKALNVQLGESLREAHGVLKDLRVETKRARRMLPMIVSQRIQRELDKQLAALGEATEIAMRDAVDRIGRQFQRLEDIYLGEDYQARKEGRPTLEELVVAEAVLYGHTRRSNDAGKQGTQEVHEGLSQGTGSSTS